MDMKNQEEISDTLTLKLSELTKIIEPPYAEEIERAVLGALMVDPNALNCTIDKVHSELFYSNAHKFIFEAILNLYENSSRVDMLTVTEKLRSTGHIDKAGGMLYVSQLATTVTSAAHIDTYVAILAEKYIKRELIHTASEIIRGAYSDKCDPIELLDTAQQTLRDVNNRVYESGAQSLDEVIDENWDFIRGDPKGFNAGILSGFTELDKMTMGFLPGTLTVLAARPANGKTTFAISVARKLSVEGGIPVLYFSLDKSKRDLMFRLVLQETGITWSEMNNWDSMPIEQRRMVFQKIQYLREFPLYIDDTPSINMAPIRSRCIKLLLQYGIRMVIIDCLQMVRANTNPDKYIDLKMETESVVKQLKNMAKELNIPVLVLSQLNRTADSRPSGEPRLADLRGTAAIEEYADNVIAIHRPSYYGVEHDECGNSTENQVVLTLMKSQSGRFGEIKLLFDKSNGCFSKPSATGADDPPILPTKDVDVEPPVSNPMQIDLPF